MLLREVFDRFDTHYAVTIGDLLPRAGIEGGSVLPDCNRDKPIESLRCLFAAFALVARLRPRYVVTTGAAPGFFCLLAGRMFGARTLWLDSVANAEKMSMCGMLSRRLASATLVQWPHLAEGEAPLYRGALL
jgi:UDP-N-acetylglucosamine:LPS N-acetylglucosamine transferase